MSRSSLQLFGRIALIAVLVVLAIWLLRRFARSGVGCRACNRQLARTSVANR